MAAAHCACSGVLATLICERLQDRPDMAMLIGGPGMGFTLRAALAELGAGARVTVAELVPAVIDWARGLLEPVFGTCLSDPRVTIAQGDVGMPIRAAKAAWDAILLDVDNGPDGRTRQKMTDFTICAALPQLMMR